MRDFIDYVIGLFCDWKSGLLWGVVAVLNPIYHYLTKNSIPDGAMVLAIAGCFFFASFRAWRRDRAPKLTSVQIERRKAIKCKYDKLPPDGQAVIRQIAIEGSLTIFGLSLNSPRFWWDIKTEGLVEEDPKNHYILHRNIAPDILAVIEDELKSHPEVRATPKHDP